VAGVVGVVGEVGPTESLPPNLHHEILRLEEASPSTPFFPKDSLKEIPLLLEDF
jgi:hypothetical protein